MKTKKDFIKLISKLNRLIDKQEKIQANFEYSFDDEYMSKTLHYMFGAVLHNKSTCCVPISVCNVRCTKQLISMGFEVCEQRNAMGTLCGFYISW